MPTVNVTIDNKIYRLACGDGQEAHLERLAAKIEGKLQEMRAAFGEIGDMRLMVMASITIADELSEMQARLDELDLASARMQRRLDQSEAAQAEVDHRLADGIRQLSKRIEKVSTALSSG